MAIEYSDYHWYARYFPNSPLFSTDEYLPVLGIVEKLIDSLKIYGLKPFVMENGKMLILPRANGMK